jgi:probable HAF family extracellular repeat protein
MTIRIHRALLGALTTLLLAVNVHAGEAGPTRYRVINLGDPEGGALSQGSSDNQPGWIAGFSVRPDNATMVAELWRAGGAIPLGTLGGPNSAVAWPNRNDHGVIVGVAETAQMQPLLGASPHREAWSCSLAVFFTAPPDGHVCRGFVWRDGRMSALPTLGGPNGFATGVNNRDQIVGWAEDPTPDPTCGEFNNTGQVLQFEAVMWVREQDDDAGTDSGYRPVELPPDTAEGDMDGAATAINQRGQVVGISGICDGAVGGATAEHMVLWRHGRVVRVLPSLGGSYWNTPMDINNRGNVAGFSDLPGDSATAPNFHAFFWSARPYDCDGSRMTGTCDLGALTGDSVSEALGVNDRDQVVGVSYPSSHAFIWQNGKMTDLNALLVPGTTLTLTDAQDINDRGVITGTAVTPAGAAVAFEAIPVH